MFACLTFRVDSIWRPLSRCASNRWVPLWNQRFRKRRFPVFAAGAAKIVHTFIPSEGSAPNGPVLQASDGNLYGTTASGGSLGSGSGVIYKLTLGGTLTVTHAFDRFSKFAEGYRPMLVCSKLLTDFSTAQRSTEEIQLADSVETDAGSFSKSLSPGPTPSSIRSIPRNLLNLKPHKSSTRTERYMDY
jgi:uncharacterized repeat protein (TIGR03803 family)